MDSLFSSQGRYFISSIIGHSVLCKANNVSFILQMVFPWMFDEFAALRPFKELANLLADKEDWPHLYDETTLRSNQVSFYSLAISISTRSLVL